MIAVLTVADAALCKNNFATDKNYIRIKPKCIDILEGTDMQSIKQTIKVPKNRCIKITLPDDVPIDEPVEIIVIYNHKTLIYSDKIQLLKNTSKDLLFKEDLNEISHSFNEIDYEEIC